MTILRAAAVQYCAGCDPAANWPRLEALVREAAGRGARYVQTPEMTNVVNRSRHELFQVLRHEDDDLFLTSLRMLAQELGIFLHIGSLALKGPQDRAVNRGFLLGPDGAILARYDKIHLFDVDLDGGESWRESATYQAGAQAVLVRCGAFTLGLAICYDLRFPSLFRTYAQKGAEILTVPSAFSRQTGEKHWHVLLRARAIENGAFVIAAAQGGRHEDGRETYGHALIIDPSGAIVAEIDGTAPGVIVADLDLRHVAATRQRIPSLLHTKDFQLTEREPAFS